MTSKKHRMIMYGVAVHLFVVAVICYAAFPVEAPEEPIRLMYPTIAGKVIFDHKTHASADGIGLDCVDCHHMHPEGEEIDPMACSTCHPSTAAREKPPESCLDCHEAEDIESPEIMKRSDALHQQCGQCHEEYGNGPRYVNEDCSKCHVR